MGGVGVQWLRGVYHENMEAIVPAVGWLPAERLLTVSGRQWSAWARIWRLLAWRSASWPRSASGRSLGNGSGEADRCDGGTVGGSSLGAQCLFCFCGVGGGTAAPWTWSPSSCRRPRHGTAHGRPCLWVRTPPVDLLAMLLPCGASGSGCWLRSAQPGCPVLLVLSVFVARSRPHGRGSPLCDIPSPHRSTRPALAAVECCMLIPRLLVGRDIASSMPLRCAGFGG